MKTVYLSLLIFLLISCQSPSSETKEITNQTTQTMNEEIYLFVGTYTRQEPHVAGKAKGIYVYKMNQVTGALTYVSHIEHTINPSFLTIHPNKKHLYAVNEHGGDGEFDSGTVSAYAIDATTKELTFLNRQSAQGVAPCYISITSSGKYALVSNYVSGNIAALPIQDNGNLSEASDIAQHEGKGTHSRQDAPHAHFVNWTPDNKLITVADLGVDKIMLHQLDETTGKFSTPQSSYVKIADEAGPRHITFHPNSNYAYCINELNGTIEAFSYNNGQFKKLQTISTLSDSSTSTGACADIHITPNGKYLYGTNRDTDNDIVGYKIDASTGKLSLISHTSTKGKTPRNFTIDPTGKFLLVANQDTDTVVTFEIDGATGQLKDTGLIAEIPTPVCLVFLE